MKRFVVIAVFASLLASAPAGADRPTNSAPNDERSYVMSGPPTAASKEREAAVGMKIRLKAGEKVLSATLINSGTARDFASLLPLTLTMNDLFRREKFAHLPRAISEGGKPASTMPTSGFCSPMMARSMLDLPEPEGPTRLTNWPVPTSMLAPSRANASAVARPMPLPAPVTNATFP